MPIICITRPHPIRPSLRLICFKTTCIEFVRGTTCLQTHLRNIKSSKTIGGTKKSLVHDFSVMWLSSLGCAKCWPRLASLKELPSSSTRFSGPISDAIAAWVWSHLDLWVVCIGNNDLAGGHTEGDKLEGGNHTICVKDLCVWLVTSAGKQGVKRHGPPKPSYLLLWPRPNPRERKREGGKRDDEALQGRHFSNTPRFGYLFPPPPTGHAMVTPSKMASRGL